MREIKFRAWFIDGESKAMVGQVCSTQGDRTLSEFFADIEDVAKEHGLKPWFMQYTGLKGKNGTEIYEGDITSSKEFDDGGYYKEYGVIAWHEHGFKWSYRGLGREWWDLDEIEDLEVIGNIHEHGELLK